MWIKFKLLWNRWWQLRNQLVRLAPSWLLTFTVYHFFIYSTFVSTTSILAFKSTNLMVYIVSEYLRNLGENVQMVGKIPSWIGNVIGPWTSFGCAIVQTSYPPKLHALTPSRSQSLRKTRTSIYNGVHMFFWISSDLAFPSTCNLNEQIRKYNLYKYLAGFLR